MSNFNLANGSCTGIGLTMLEAADLRQFIWEHQACHSNITICTSIASGIGQNVVVECQKHPAKSQRDITDYGSW